MRLRTMSTLQFVVAALLLDSELLADQVDIRPRYVAKVCHITGHECMFQSKVYESWQTFAREAVLGRDAYRFRYRRSCSFTTYISGQREITIPQAQLRLPLALPQHQQTQPRS